jgi:hypothetical protein
MTRWRVIRWGLLPIYGLLAYALDAVAASAPLFLLLAMVLLLLGSACALASCLLQLMTKKRTGRGIVFLRWSLIAVVLGVVGLLGGFFYSPPPVPIHDLPVGEELAYMQKTDQSDRFRILRWFVMAERDRRRLERTNALYDSGEIVDPQDKFHAACIFQHGLNDSANYEKAYRLASDAADAGVLGADWLKNAAYDRWMMSLGKSQEHGTQFQITFP